MAIRLFFLTLLFLPCFAQAATISPAITRSDGDSVWLYKKSDGVQVLYGSAPDYGAYEYQGAVRKLNNVTGVRVELH